MLHLQKGEEQSSFRVTVNPQAEVTTGERKNSSTDSDLLRFPPREEHF